ncbi:ABC-type multidrug transport system, ATPase component [Streptomyces sp. WMMB 714]|uniref:ATP-binding cassette domain-containing protein n=1 Tax=Streptomyces sp. WMMB 714 TaxID=1286822 RepID=UPI0005F83F2D|nr:ATP-binding cassette domain-containing protein [Streptomyces sp. WMMB 714]SCK48290.1 ABC-type multidrug transport system, ATPase component [Streptomyces sp. WMMB 714]
MIQAIGLTSLPRRHQLKPTVDDLTFEARPGRVTVLLGPRGSGKTTALRLMLQLQPGRGVALFRGRPVQRIVHLAREVGTLLGDVPGHPARTARGHLRMLSAAAGVPVSRADDVLDVVGLSGLADKRIGELSRGMDRRLAVACALLGDPHTLILDEPAQDLSPRETSWLYSLLRGYANEGGTVLVTSRRADEAADLADRVVSVDSGCLMADQEVADFVRTRLRPRVAVRTPHADRLAAVLTDEARRAGPGRDSGPLKVVREDGNHLSVYGSSCAEVGEYAYRNNILVHQLTDESGDVGDVGAPEPLVRADGRRPVPSTASLSRTGRSSALSAATDSPAEPAATDAVTAPVQPGAASHGQEPEESPEADIEPEPDGAARTASGRHDDEPPVPAADSSSTSATWGEEASPTADSRPGTTPPEPSSKDPGTPAAASSAVTAPAQPDADRPPAVDTELEPKPGEEPDDDHEPQRDREFAEAELAPGSTPVPQGPPDTVATSTDSHAVADSSSAEGATLERSSADASPAMALSAALTPAGRSEGNHSSAGEPDRSRSHVNSAPPQADVEAPPRAGGPEAGPAGPSGTSPAPQASPDDPTVVISVVPLVDPDAPSRGSKHRSAASAASAARPEDGTAAAQSSSTQSGWSPSCPPVPAAAELPPPLHAVARPGPVAPLSYELRRLFGVRTTWIVVAAAVVVALCLSLVMAWTGLGLPTASSSTVAPAVRLLSGWPPGGFFLLPPVALAVGVLGALAFGEEFRFPALVPARPAVPHKLSLLASKLAVSAVLSVVLCLFVAGLNVMALTVFFGPEVFAFGTSNAVESSAGSLFADTGAPVGGTPWQLHSAALVAFTVGCGWTGLLAAGVFRSAAAGAAVVLAVPLLVSPALRELFSESGGRSLDGLSERLEAALLVPWPPGSERWVSAVVELVSQPAGPALGLVLLVLSFAYLVTAVRSRAR